jgi:hypothetical protein
MASRSITVKVATPKVIAALESKLAQVKNDYVNQDQLEAKFQQDLRAWNKALTEYALANIDKAENFRTNYRSWNHSLNIDFDVDTKGKDFPAQPERDFEQIHRHSYNEMVQEISNALSILRMTDEETVNASTFKSIAKYL